MAAASNSDERFDRMLKLLIIGNSSVGKTCFLYRYSNDAFTSAFVATVGIDFKVKTLLRDDKRIKLQIWDTAGQERYRTITTAYYREAVGFILMYDVTNEESYKSVADWANQITAHSEHHQHVVLVGNKCDMEEDREVTIEDGQKMADTFGFTFFETSAKDNHNVGEVFEKLVEIICERLGDDEGDVRDGKTPTADLAGKRGGHSGCAC